MNDAHIERLLEQRAAYVKLKRPDRVEQVDLELARYGVDPTAKSKPKSRKQTKSKVDD